MARPDWDPAEQKGQNQLLHLESTVGEGYGGSEELALCGLHLEEKVTEISGIQKGTSAWTCLDCLAV